MATTAPSPRPWPWWMAPAAILLALGMTILASALVAAALAGAGVKDVLHNGTVNVVLTVVQDAAFVAGPLLIAAAWARPRAAQFGLVRAPLRRVAKWVAVAVVVYIVFALAFSQVAGGREQKDIFRELGIHKGSEGVLPLAFVVCVIAPLAEEFLFRGFCYSALRSALGFAGAAAVVGLVFGAIHVTSTPPVLLIQLAVLGALLCVVREKTGSLLPCIGLHATNNAISFGALVGWGWGTFGLLAGALGACGLVLAPLTARRAAR